MRAVSKFGVMLTAVLVVATPTMACLIPAAALTAAERECCKQMAEQCGNAGMAASHSCCRQLTSPDSHSFVVPHSQHGFGNIVIVGTEANPITFNTPIPSFSAHTHWFDEVHGPPESPPASTPVLRI